MALQMAPDTEALNARVASATTYLDLLPDTGQQYLGLYDDERPQDSRAAALRNHLMVRRNYSALTSGDGACAGCGEKTVLHVIASLTEAYMRPTYHRHADRLEAKATELEHHGVARLEALAARDLKQHELFRKTVAHAVMNLGGENDADTASRMRTHELDDAALIGALTAVMRQEASNRRDVQAIDGRLENGMSVMAMGANTGCNTVYGSTPPNNPHPYPWMNSLFQDGTTISWMLSENFIENHGRRAVIPERLTDALLSDADTVLTEETYFDFTHFSDALMTDDEILEMPKVWCVGGDGGLGDIGFQNLSKVILQNRPNLSVVMLDTQVYSNTGGQNSDSTPMPGGGDMNALGAATQGKLIEKKGVAEILTAGHGSPFVAQISMADEPRFFEAILDGLEYRGTSFFQSFTTCQPEHGVGDNMSTVQATLIRDSRGMPQFVFDPSGGRDVRRGLQPEGQPQPGPGLEGLSPARREAQALVHGGALGRDGGALPPAPHQDLGRAGQGPGPARPPHALPLAERRTRAALPGRTPPGLRAGLRCPTSQMPDGRFLSVSRQLVLFCVERRKAWRMLQSKAGVTNKDYPAHRALLAKLAAGELTRDHVWARGRELLESGGGRPQRLTKLNRFRALARLWVEAADEPRDRDERTATPRAHPLRPRHGARGPGGRRRRRGRGAGDLARGAQLGTVPARTLAFLARLGGPPPGFGHPPPGGDPAPTRDRARRTAPGGDLPHRARRARGGRSRAGPGAVDTGRAVPRGAAAALLRRSAAAQDRRASRAAGRDGPHANQARAEAGARADDPATRRRRADLGRRARALGLAASSDLRDGGDRRDRAGLVGAGGRARHRGRPRHHPALGARGGGTGIGQ